MRYLPLWLACWMWGLPAGLQALDASITHAVFQGEDGGYVELYFHFTGRTVTFSPDPEGQQRAVLHVSILFLQEERVVRFDNYRLNSPAFDTASDFVDLKRYALANGAYVLDVTVRDAADTTNMLSYREDFTVDYSGSLVRQSGIQLLASCQPVESGADNPMVKSGFCFEPLPYQFLSRRSGLLIFYCELYNTDKQIGEDFLVRYFLDNADTPQQEETILAGYKRKSAASVIPFLAQMDVQTLPSGNYHLVVEIRDRTQVLLSRQSVFFQRSNPFLVLSDSLSADSTAGLLSQEFVSRLDEQELAYSLRAIAMQVDKEDGDHLNLLIRKKQLDAMRLYLFQYWTRQNAIHPEGAWDAYMAVARKIDEKFRNGFRFGFETDRGYIFMKYGAPSDVVSVETEPSAPPYEIWYYNQFPQTGQNNVRFLFYNPSLATNGHVLLHSTARGEVYNPRWEVELYRNAPNEGARDNFIDNTRMQDNIGRQARRLFDNF
ncbi:MAG: hypothetical protein RLY31_2779 [Bacteroidota bacterium]|jgi:GWxTD domain-containing protein